MTAPRPLVAVIALLLCVCLSACTVRGRSGRGGGPGDDDDSATPDDVTPPGDDDDATLGDDDDTPPGDDDDQTSDEPQLARGVAIERVSIYQGVEIPLVDGGVTVSSRPAPVVFGRGALLRVFVEREAGATARIITATLTLQSIVDGVVSLEQSVLVSGDSTDASLQSTFNFELTPDDVTPDTSWSVELFDLPASGPFEGSDAGARHPAQGREDLDAISSGGGINLVLLPVSYNADGSGRLPDTSPAQLQRYEDLMYALFPVTEVTVSVGDVIPWSGSISPGGSGWSSLLNEVVSLRSSANVPSNTYYYGLFSPGSSMSSFCGGGCQAGLSMLGYDPTADYLRASIGLGFSGQLAAEFLVHEVGHAHGREHAPCGVGGQTDSSYPYSGGGVGSWGYDLIAGELKSPSDFADLMGYCKPLWVSDYNYDALFDRVSYLNAQSAVTAPSDWDPQWSSISVGHDGSWQPGPDIRVGLPPSGEQVEVPLIDDQEQPAGSVVGIRLPHDHSDGGLLLVPPLAAGLVPAL